MVTIDRNRSIESQRVKQKSRASSLVSTQKFNESWSMSQSWNDMNNRKERGACHKAVEFCIPTSWCGRQWELCDILSLASRCSQLTSRPGKSSTTETSTDSWATRAAILANSTAQGWRNEWNCNLTEQIKIATSLSKLRIQCLLHTKEDSSNVKSGKISDLQKRPNVVKTDNQPPAITREVYPHCEKFVITGAIVTIRSDAKESTFWGARLDVLIFGLRCAL